jgi:glyoxylase-like metal-dependent hydrolase (beta-lactamase superfamily II)
MQLDGWDIDIVVQGFPGKAVCHGGMGWSTVVLIRGQGRVALVDAGNFGMRKMLIERLHKRGLTPKNVTDLLLTHSHYDHSVNWTLVRHARIVIGKVELDWSLTVPWGETPVPELYVEALDRWETVVRAGDGEVVFPGMTAHIAPGHTPGCLVYVLHGKDRDVIFTGDAAKNRAEMISRDTDMTYDVNVSRASIEMIWELWRRKPGSILVPGHDLPMTQENGVTRYIGRREAQISAWFGDGMDQTTLIELAVG